MYIVYSLRFIIKLLAHQDLIYVYIGNTHKYIYIYNYKVHMLFCIAIDMMVILFNSNARGQLLDIHKALKNMIHVIYTKRAINVQTYVLS